MKKIKLMFGFLVAGIASCFAQPAAPAKAEIGRSATLFLVKKLSADGTAQVPDMVGTGPFVYVWDKDGKTPANNSAWRKDALELQNLKATDSGTYTLTVSNSAGETKAALVVTIVLLPPGGAKLGFEVK